MTEQSSKDRLRTAVDSTLSGLTGDPFLYQRVIAHKEEGETPMKKHPKLSAGLVTALICIMSMLTVAAASGVLYGQVNWQGTEEPLPVSTPMPTPIPTDLTAKITEVQKEIDQVSELLNSCPEGEMIKVAWQEDGTRYANMQKPLRFFRSQEEADALLKDMAPLPRLLRVPDAYFLKAGCATYDCRDTGKYDLLSTEIIDGLTVTRCGLSDNAGFISACAWSLYPESGEVRGLGDLISVRVSLEEASKLENRTFGVQEGETVRTLEVPGMTDALFITSDEKAELFMHRPLEESVGYFDPQMNENSQYDAVFIDIYAPAGTEADTLLSILDIR